MTQKEWAVLLSLLAMGLSIITIGLNLFMWLGR